MMNLFMTLIFLTLVIQKFKEEERQNKVKQADFGMIAIDGP